MNRYETIYITHPESPESKVNTINSKITDVVKKHSGKVDKVDNWGTRRLGYAIKNDRRGHYVCVTYTADGSVIRDLERTLKLREDILKQMTIKVEKGD